MISIPKIGRKWSLILHSFGLSCLGAALFLQSIVFTGILQNGYFRGIEENSVILSFEIVLTGFAIAYFAYTFVRFIISHKT